MVNNNNSNWHDCLKKVWKLNRTHVSKEMSESYNILISTYRGSKLYKFKSGEEFNGWTIPYSWDVNDARLIGPDGNVLCSWKKNKLSLWMYSESFRGTISKKELLNHLLTDSKRPNATLFHFRNQYRHWNKEWGFSMPYNIYKKLKDGDYEVDIKTEKTKGDMRMVEYTHKGKYKDSFLLVGHFDHPQMCADGLIGCLAAKELIKRLSKLSTKFTYRALSTVEIIGSVFYAKKYAKKNKIKEALFVASSGIDAPLHYQKSFNDSFINKAMEHLLKIHHPKTKISNFRQGPLGNDEIAFDNNAVNISCGSIMRGPFKEYHTDLDNINIIKEKKFEEKIELLKDLIFILENNSVYKSNFTGLPSLNSQKYDLYLSPINISKKQNKHALNHKLGKVISKKSFKFISKYPEKLNIMMNIFPNICNGKFTTLDIAIKIGLPFEVVYEYSKMWANKNFLKITWVNSLEKSNQ